MFYKYVEQLQIIYMQNFLKKLKNMIYWFQSIINVILQNIFTV